MRGTLLDLIEMTMLSKVVLLQKAHMVHGAFHHGLRGRGAVLGQDLLFQAAAVDADADGHMFLALQASATALDAVIAADVAGVDLNPARTATSAESAGGGSEWASPPAGAPSLYLQPPPQGARGGGEVHADDLAARRDARLLWATLPAISLTGTFSIV